MRHAYFQDYHKLQQLCLMILNKRKHTVGNKKSKVFGILIDIAWLWEEYLNTLLKIGSFTLKIAKEVISVHVY